jgi:hypothetical protein
MQSCKFVLGWKWLNKCCFDLEITKDLVKEIGIKIKNKPMAPTILERGLPICGLRPNHVCEVRR